MNDQEREVLALLLEANADMAVGALQKDARGFSPLGALAAARVLEQRLGDAMHALATEAKAAGHTWQEIADVASTTRQAAFARFGAPRKQQRRVRPDPIRMSKRALAIFDDLIAGRWEPMRREFDSRVGAGVSETDLEAVRVGILARWGSVESCGEPTVRSAIGVTVVDVPVEFQNGPARFRMTFDADTRVSGLFLLRGRPDLASPGGAG